MSLPYVRKSKTNAVGADRGGETGLFKRMNDALSVIFNNSSTDDPYETPAWQPGASGNEAWPSGVATFGETSRPSPLPATANAQIATAAEDQTATAANATAAAPERVASPSSAVVASPSTNLPVTFTSVDFGVVDTSWKITGADPTNIIWRNANGDLLMWNVSGQPTKITGSRDYGVVDNNWQVAGVSDGLGTFAGSSLLWRNTNGDTLLWNPDGHGGFSARDLGVVDNSWQIAGVGKGMGAYINGASIVWRNANGDTELWDHYLGNNTYVGHDLGIVDSSWKIAAVGNFVIGGINGTADSSDILWRNANGDTLIWGSEGSDKFYGQDLGIVDKNYQIVGSGDIDRNGYSDIVWRNSINGDTLIWYSDGAHFAGQDLGNIPADYKIAGINQFQGTAGADIVWRGASGDTQVWNPHPTF